MKAKDFARLSVASLRRHKPPRLRDVDLSPKLGKHAYKKSKDELKSQLVAAQLELKERGQPVMIVFEGWDAAGKGGAIHRLVNKIDPRSYIVHPISAPTQEEKDHHYLWRFWRALPPRGRIAVFDRSWYGRVLVERIEGFAKQDEWKRAYAEINDFERLLALDGALIIKIFLHISKDEQKRRFDRRSADPLKSWKLNQEDYRNRRKWGAYENAIDDMFARTHTPQAPWIVIAANDKRWARLAVQQAVLACFTQALQAKKRS